MLNYAWAQIIYSMLRPPSGNKAANQIHLRADLPTTVIGGKISMVLLLKINYTMIKSKPSIKL